MKSLVFVSRLLLIIQGVHLLIAAHHSVTADAPTTRQAENSPIRGDGREDGAGGGIDKTTDAVELSTISNENINTQNATSVTIDDSFGIDSLMDSQDFISTPKNNLELDKNDSMTTYLPDKKESMTTYLPDKKEGESGIDSSSLERGTTEKNNQLDKNSTVDGKRINSDIQVSEPPTRKKFKLSDHLANNFRKGRRKDDTNGRVAASEMKGSKNGEVADHIIGREKDKIGEVTGRNFINRDNQFNRRFLLSPTSETNNNNKPIAQRNNNNEYQDIWKPVWPFSNANNNHPSVPLHNPTTPYPVSSVASRFISRTTPLVSSSFLFQKEPVTAYYFDLNSVQPANQAGPLFDPKVFLDSNPVFKPSKSLSTVLVSATNLISSTVPIYQISSSTAALNSEGTSSTFMPTIGSPSLIPGENAKVPKSRYPIADVEDKQVNLSNVVTPSTVLNTVLETKTASAILDSTEQNYDQKRPIYVKKETVSTLETENPIPNSQNIPIIEKSLHKNETYDNTEISYYDDEFLDYDVDSSSKTIGNTEDTNFTSEALKAFEEKLAGDMKPSTLSSGLQNASSGDSEVGESDSKIGETESQTEDEESQSGGSHKVNVSESSTGIKLEKVEVGDTGTELTTPTVQDEITTEKPMRASTSTEGTTKEQSSSTEESRNATTSSTRMIETTNSSVIFENGSSTKSVVETTFKKTTESVPNVSVSTETQETSVETPETTTEARETSSETIVFKITTENILEKKIMVLVSNNSENPELKLIKISRNGTNSSHSSPFIKAALKYDVTEYCFHQDKIRSLLKKWINVHLANKTEGTPFEIEIFYRPDCKNLYLIDNGGETPNKNTQGLSQSGDPTVIYFYVTHKGQISPNSTILYPRDPTNIKIDRQLRYLKERILHLELMNSSTSSLPLAEAPLDSSLIIGVVVTSLVALLIIIAVLVLIIIRKRRAADVSKNRRCTPAAKDNYSLDSVSVFYHSFKRKSRKRASNKSLKSYLNQGFDDPNGPTNQLNFNKLTQFVTDSEAIYDEFTDIPSLSPNYDDLPRGVEDLNRYANVIPISQTRVLLGNGKGSPMSEYINANFIHGPKNELRYYIATQAPLDNTVADFWQMVWEQESRIVVMVTDFVEKGVDKCADYLPPSETLDCHRVYGEYQITLKSRDMREKYIVSMVQIKNLENNLVREVAHMWYTGWPHVGVPKDEKLFISFILDVRMTRKQLRAKGPIVVHCSPGTGRTGTYIICDLCMRQFDDAKAVDVPKTVFRMRRERAGAVQTKEQYLFIYRVVNLYAAKLMTGNLDSF